MARLARISAAEGAGEDEADTDATGAAAAAAGSGVSVFGVTGAVAEVTTGEAASGDGATTCVLATAGTLAMPATEAGRVEILTSAKSSVTLATLGEPGAGEPGAGDSPRSPLIHLVLCCSRPKPSS